MRVKGKHQSGRGVLRCAAILILFFAGIGLASAQAQVRVLTNHSPVTLDQTTPIAITGVTSCVLTAEGPSLADLFIVR